MNPKQKNWMAFLWGLGSVTQIRIVGAMGITEAICVFLSPFIFVKLWPQIKQTVGKRILILLLAWFLSAIITDLYRETLWENAVRGIFSLPFLFSVFVVAFALLRDDLLRVRWMVLGTAFSGIISIFVFQPQSLLALATDRGSSVQDVFSFKSIYASVALMGIGAVVVYYFQKRPRTVVFIQLLASGLFLVQGFRNGFLILLFSAFGAWLARSRFLSLRRLQKNMVVLVVISIVGLLLAMEIYSAAVQRGWLGEQELEKYEQQSDSDIGLLEGRAHFIGALLAIKDSPFLGHGSWAVDKKDYGGRMYSFIGDKEQLRQYYGRAFSGDPWIPTHSHLWQAWVWHGFMGGVFWIYIIGLITMFLKHGLHLCRPLIAYNILIFLSSMWDIFFSPFYNRPRWGMIFAIITICLAEVERRRKSARTGGTAPDMETAWDGKTAI